MFFPPRPGRGSGAAEPLGEVTGGQNWSKGLSPGRDRVFASVLSHRNIVQVIMFRGESFTNQK